MSGSNGGARNLRYRIAAVIFGLLVSAGASAAQITGTVTNATTNKPSVDDEVVLLSLSTSMEEVAKTKTDSRGRFALNVPDDNGQHLVRVLHQNVHYFQGVPPGATTVDITVYDAATQVEGLITDARVFHLQASGGSMDVQELYILNNQSQPPRTKIGNQTFAITLPDGAEMGQASLTGSSGMPVPVATVPSGAKDRYAYDFPIRPGQTRFEVTYKIPYSGSHEFVLKAESALSELGVLLPKSMKFNGTSPAFSQDRDEEGLAVFFAKNLTANQEVKFFVSGEGLIFDAAQGGNSNQPAGESSGSPISSSSSGTHGLLWFVVGALVVLIVGGAFVMWRKGAGARAGAAPDPRAAKAASKAKAQAQTAKPERDILEALKDELFQLETDRVSGKISQEEYEKSKAGLDTLFRRQMKKRS